MQEMKLRCSLEPALFPSEFLEYLQLWSSTHAMQPERERLYTIVLFVFPKGADDLRSETVI